VGVGTGKRELAGSRGEMMEQGETWTRASRAPQEKRGHVLHVPHLTHPPVPALGPPT
jgi:hypothetical protein